VTPRISSPVQIRQASASDIPAIIRVVNAAFAIETFMEGTRTDEERMSSMLKEGEFLVAVAGDEIVASVYVEIRGERGYFGMLAVDPSQQSSGLGRQMVKSAEDYCRQRECRYMDIAVLSLRPELQPFYGQLEYLETGREEFHPSRPLRAGVECHCIVMSKAL